MKFQANTQEFVGMLEGLGLMESFKNAVSGAVLSACDGGNVKRVIEDRLRSEVEKVVKNQLHGTGYFNGILNGPLGQEVKAGLLEEIKANHGLRAIVKEYVDQAINTEIRTLVQQAVAQAFIDRIDDRISNTNIEQQVRIAAKEAIAKLSQIGG